LTDALKIAANKDNQGKPETILVVTDGAPTNKDEFEVWLENYSKKAIKATISFVQVGDDFRAKLWLNGLQNK